MTELNLQSFNLLNLVLLYYKTLCLGSLTSQALHLSFLKAFRTVCIAPQVLIFTVFGRRRHTGGREWPQTVCCLIKDGFGTKPHLRLNLRALGLTLSTGGKSCQPTQFYKCVR